MAIYFFVTENLKLLYIALHHTHPILQITTVKFLVYTMTKKSESLLVM